MTREQYNKLKINDRVKVVRNTCSHGYEIGRKYYIGSGVGGSGSSLRLKVERDGVANPSYVCPDDIEKLKVSGNLAKKALNDEIAAKKKEIEDLQKELEWASRYKDNLDEAVKTFNFGDCGLRLEEREIKRFRTALYKHLVSCGVEQYFDRPPEKVETLGGSMIIPPPSIELESLDDLDF